MPYAALQLEPGINTNISPMMNRRGWAACEKIRWRNGLPEKLGGWQRLTSTLLVGIARALHAWSDLGGNPYMIIGTDQRLQLFDGGQIVDITPLRATANITVDFSTTSGSAIITVTDLAHGAAPDDWVYLVTHVSVGGLVLYGYYQVATVIDADNYTIIAPANATANVSHGGAVASFHTNNTLATVDVTLNDHGLSVGQLYVVEIPVTVGGITIEGTYAVASITSANVFVITHSAVATSSATASENGGQARFLYLLPSGQQSAEYATGYGVGDYGAGDYGGASTASGALVRLRQWFWDTWGEYALGNYIDGPLYVWIPPSGRAQQIGGSAPTMNTASFVSMPQQIAVALGSETGGVRDPNLVRWSSVTDYTDFIATVTNQAGAFRIPSGSRIVGGLQGPQQALIWTDLDVWSMRYLGPPFVFGFTKIADGCGLLSARSMAIIGTEVYWASTNGIFMLGSEGVRQVEMTVYDKLFGTAPAGGPAINQMQVDKIFAAPHADNSELSWFAPSSAGDGECDIYVKMNVKEKNSQGAPLWDYGNMRRTAWQDESALGRPIGADVSGLLQQHEVSADADGQPLISWARTGFLDVKDGEFFVFIDRLEPDMISTDGAVVDLTVYAKKAPRGDQRSFGPYRFLDDSGVFNPRVRGKYVAFEVGSSDMGSWWRCGLNRYRYAPDGWGG